MAQHLARVYSAELEGIRARLIEVEVDLHVGLHAFNIVGLADKALAEARERVNSALKNSDIKPPSRENRKITVNLAPADVKKAGSQYDLAIAVGYLLATEQMEEFDADKTIFIGELALDGRVRPAGGALNIATMARDRGFATLVLPFENANEAAVVRGLNVIPIKTLAEAIAHLEGAHLISPAAYSPEKTPQRSAPDFADIKGQAHAKRALVIAAAGGHNLLMSGPPGVGKSLLAHALTGILPPMEFDEALETTKVYSAAGLSPGGLLTERPFRSPHQTASLVAVVGGGPDPKPGEISLAHRGVLFLDELPEFPSNILEALRSPLEEGTVHVARARGSLSFPAKFTLVAAMNPCPCGFYGDREKECRCSAHEVLRYQKKISGPLLDRIDLQVKVPRVGLAELRSANSAGGSSAEAKEAVRRARNAQRGRLAPSGITVNAEMSSKQTEKFCALDDAGQKIIRGIEKKFISPRGYYRLLKTARTIADLDAQEKVSADHLAEAFSYRIAEES